MAAVVLIILDSSDSLDSLSDPYGSPLQNNNVSLPGLSSWPWLPDSAADTDSLDSVDDMLSPPTLSFATLSHQQLGISLFGHEAYAPPIFHPIHPPVEPKWDHWKHASLQFLQFALQWLDLFSACIGLGRLKSVFGGSLGTDSVSSRMWYT